MAVGHLFLAFSRLENLLTSTLKLHLASNIGPPDDNRAIRLASAIYGSMRFKASRDTIKRILKVEKRPSDLVTFVEAAFEQIGHIESFRDKLAHQMVVPAHPNFGGFWQTNDAATTRDITSPRVYVFDTPAVGYAADDLILVANRLGSRAIGRQLFDQNLDLSPISWRYKSSMLKLVPHKLLRNLQE